jgi:hypothetical protein
LRIARGLVRDFQKDRVGAVTRARDEDAVAGLGSGEHVGEHERRVRCAGLADGERKRIGHLLRSELRAARELVGGARVRRVEHDLGEIAGRALRLFEDALHGGAEEWAVRLGQREALFPGVGEPFAGRAPGVEELARDRRRRHDLCDRIVADHEGDPGVAAGLLGLAFGGRDPTVRDRDER